MGLGPDPAPGAGAGDEMEGDGRDRKAFVLERPLSPHSIIGSWVLGFDGDQVSFQGLIVAEPQAGTYLVEVFTFIDNDSRQRGGTYQKLVQIGEFSSQDNDYRFYDDDIKVRVALGTYRPPSSKKKTKDRSSE